jgi:hypothetical protein
MKAAGTSSGHVMLTLSAVAHGAGMAVGTAPALGNNCIASMPLIKAIKMNGKAVEDVKRNIRMTNSNFSKY